MRYALFPRSMDITVSVFNLCLYSVPDTLAEYEPALFSYADKRLFTPGKTPFTDLPGSNSAQGKISGNGKRLHTHYYVVCRSLADCVITGRVQGLKQNAEITVNNNAMQPKIR